MPSDQFATVYVEVADLPQVQAALSAAADEIAALRTTLGAVHEIASEAMSEYETNAMRLDMIDRLVMRHIGGPSDG